MGILLILGKTAPNLKNLSLRKKCLYAEVFWSVLSLIWIEHGDLQSKYLYLIQVR